MAKKDFDITASIKLVDSPKVKAMANIKFVVDKKDFFVVGGAKVIQGTQGLFVSMPQYKNANGEYKDVAFPLTKGGRDYINKLVLSEYDKIADNKPSGTDDDIPF